jgi:alcohol dehydrogenase class IV
VANLARVDEGLHRTPRLFDGHGPINSVLIVEVDDVNAETAKRLLTGAHHVLGLAVDPLERAVLSALVAKLRGQYDLAATVPDGAPHEHLIRERPVHVGGVEEVDTTVDRLVDRRDRLCVVANPVELAHAHATEALLGDLEALTQLSTLHRGSLCEIAHNPLFAGFS